MNDLSRLEQVVGARTWGHLPDRELVPITMHAFLCPEAEVSQSLLGPHPRHNQQS